MRGIISLQAMFVLLAALAVVGISAGPAMAADVTWDITPGTVGAGDSAITGGTGTWDTTTGNWTTDGGANNVAWDNTANPGDTAVYHGYSGHGDA